MASTTNPLLKQAFWTPKYVTANKILTGTDSGTVWANPNATANVTLTLPKATGSGITYGFVQVNAHSMSIAPLTGDTIRGLAASTSFTLTNGSTVTLITVQSGYWDVFPSYFPDGITTGPGGSTLGGIVNFTGTPELNGVPMFQSGSFTGTLTGMTATTTGTVKYAIVGNLCNLLASFTGTSNAATMTLTGLPAACIPTTAQFIPCIVENNGLALQGAALLAAASSVITFALAETTLVANFIEYAQAFTATGTKGLDELSLTYSLQ
jgi:hypothetical protein